MKKGSVMEIGGLLLTAMAVLAVGWYITLLANVLLEKTCEPDKTQEKL